MNAKKIPIMVALLMIASAVIIPSAMASDLIVVASPATQEAVQNWLAFLESKEVPVKLVTPDAFPDYKNELYIVVMGGLDEPGGIKEIAKDALTAEEFEAAANSSQGKMYVKPQAWNVGQKVILFVGPDQKAAEAARKASREEWFEMFQEWFDIVESEGLHAY